MVDNSKEHLSKVTDVNVCVVEITPELATNWLKVANKEGSNRKITKSYVDGYAQEMKADNWPVTGESIIFSVTGRLLNGQHRLLACVQSQSAFKSVVVKGVLDTCFKQMDSGNKRTLSDSLEKMGVPNSRLVASAVNFVYNYFSSLMVSENGRKYKLVTRLATELLENNKGIEQSASLIAKLSKETGFTKVTDKTAAGFHYIMSLVDREKADEFFTSLSTGLNLSESSPIWILRNRLERREKTKLIASKTVEHYIIKAWNAFYGEEKLTLVHISKSSKPTLILGITKEMRAEATRGLNLVDPE
jgi:hypothetical protein